MAALNSDEITVTVNGNETRVAAGASVRDLLVALELDPERVAVELDRAILKKEHWAGAFLRGGESLEVVHFVGGG